MLEAVDLKKKLSKEEYKEWFPKLKEELRTLQRKAYEAELPVIVLFEGWDAAGKGESIRELVEQLDPRGYQVHPISAPVEEERLRPWLWRFWTKIPARGQMAVFDRSWYGRVLIERVDKLCKKREWKQAYEEICQFERQLADDGTVIVKFWLHISKKEQKKRFKRCEADPYLKWKVEPEDWKRHKQYDEYVTAAEEMFERTSTHEAPWTIVESTDRRFRNMKVVQTVCQAIQAGLNAKATRESLTSQPHVTVSAPVLEGMPSILDKVDLSVSLDEPTYKLELKKWQARLRELEFECYRHRLPVVIGYEGWDAAGKGGNIRRLTEPLDPRGFSVTPIAAPKGEEATHHYLWRFWKAIPKAGHITVFDRTWYGRVLVERIEGFCTETEWRRAYQEINEFEAQLAVFPTVIVKFWLHISPEEQLARFKKREETPYKRYKITEEDWRNREKWDDYKRAVIEMLTRTSTTYAPWTIVEGNCKWWARIKTLKTVCKAIESQLKRMK